ncbi:hypothetical protein AGMMS50293_24630 [Spirochaetia bacterium]|nr:hypothetical protein AGMMS50293_24630 [Spirochaetia bacterium]
MKKLIAVSILLVLLSATAFAQFKVGFKADIAPEFLAVKAPTGDYKDATPDDNKATFDLLSSSFFDATELRLTFGYTGENVQALLELKLDDLIKRGNDTATGGLDSILASSFGDYYVKGTAGKLYGYFGNTADRGKTTAGRYQNFNDYLRFKVDNFGIITGVTTTTGSSPSNLAVTAIDVNSLRNNGATSQAATKGPYVSFGLNFSPIFIEIASDLGMEQVINATNANSQSKVGGAFRVSGEKVADLVNFDVIYRISGRDTNTRKDSNNTGSWNNSFGLYANLALTDTFGISAGYSGAVLVTEKNDVAGVGTIKTTNPFYSGIDLRFFFSGVDKLKITFNNNISFAGNKGSSSATENNVGVTGTLSDGEKDSWFALYNALGADYAITDKLTGTLQLANVLGVTKEEATGYESTNTKDIFEVALSTLYKFNANVNFEAGVLLGITSEKDEATGSTSGDAGYIYFGIPLRFKVTF